VEKNVDYFLPISAESPVSSLAICAFSLIDNINPFISAESRETKQPEGLGLREWSRPAGLRAFHNLM
jgi:hypothetical protein